MAKKTIEDMTAAADRAAAAARKATEAVEVAAKKAEAAKSESAQKNTVAALNKALKVRDKAEANAKKAEKAFERALTGKGEEDGQAKSGAAGATFKTAAEAQMTNVASYKVPKKD